ncbi:MAG: hypothetical protein WA709_04265 [Stellaceae bacterium]
MSSSVTPIDDFSVAEFASGRISHRVYRKGAGPDVLLMHELPGMTPQFIGLKGARARRRWSKLREWLSLGFTMTRA